MVSCCFFRKVIIFWVIVGDSRVNYFFGEKGEV